MRVVEQIDEVWTVWDNECVLTVQTMNNPNSDYYKIKILFSNQLCTIYVSNLHVVVNRNNQEVMEQSVFYLVLPKLI